MEGEDGEGHLSSVKKPGYFGICNLLNSRDGVLIRIVIASV